jgi:hypothetical protein
MPQYAQFDPTVEEPAPVLGWYDTDALHYPNLPAQDALLLMTADQWAHRMDQAWAVEGGAFVAYTPPEPPEVPTEPPSLQDQAAAMMNEPVTVVSQSMPSLNAQYQNDPPTRQHITTITMAYNGGLGLPGGGRAFQWWDVDGTTYLWPAMQFVSFAQAVMNFVYACTQVVNGESTELPSSTLTIT